MGIILNALDTDIRRDVAMKIMTEAGQTSADNVERFIDDVQAAAFSPDGTLLVSGSGDKTILLWKLGDALNRRRPAR